MKAIDHTGRKYGRLTVLRRGSIRGRRPQQYWVCACSCGQEKEVSVERLANGQTQSCGCLRRETTSKRRRSHGMTGSKEYYVWSAAKGRCYNSNDSRYQYYGAMGVTMCDRWRNSFENFIADMGFAPPGHSIDRIDSDGPYSPENCRWADAWTQNANRRHTTKIEWEGRTFVLASLARHLGLSYRGLRYWHLRLGLPLDEAVRRTRPATHSP